jgi:hypothetical protein
VHRHLTRVLGPAFPFPPSRPPRHEPHPRRRHRAAGHDHRLRPDRLPPLIVVEDRGGTRRCRTTSR